MKASWSDSDSSESESEEEQANLCLNAEQEDPIEVITKTKDYKWIMDSGCSRHMSGKSSLFSELSQQKGGTIILGDKKKCDIIGIGKVEQVHRILFLMFT